METSRIREFKNFCLAALLIASATLAACSSSDDNIIEEQPVQPTEKVYTMTIQATKATKGGYDATTRGLDLSNDGHTLNVKWANTDQVAVFPNSWESSIGTLTASASNDGSTTLSGDVTTSGLTTGNKVQMLFPRATWDYTGQKGVLHSAENSIEKMYDYAVANPEITVDGSNISANASFESQQAIVKFTLQDKTGTDLPVTSLTISAAGGKLVQSRAYTALGMQSTYSTLTVTPASGTNTLTVALRNELGAADTYMLTATVGNDTYIYEKSEVTFTNGKYYDIKVKMYRLINKKTDEKIKTGDILTGTYEGWEVRVAAGATVTLENFNLTNYSKPGIYCEGDATIILKGENNLKAVNCIGIAAEKSLYIDGNGSLVATANREDLSAAIGGTYKGTCGNISIEGGNITAIGGGKAAAIGSGYMGYCGDISIVGGTVTATGNDYSPGVGAANLGDCGDIDLGGEGLVLNAIGDDAAAGIGTGFQGKCGKIIISDRRARIKAKKGNSSDGTGKCSLGPGTDDSIVGQIVIESIVYWDNGYTNGGETLLTQDEFVYPIPGQ